MKLHIFCYRILSTIVLIWVNFLNSILVMKSINTNRTYKAFLNSTTNRSNLGNYKQINSVAQKYLNSPITLVGTKFKGHLKPFSQSSREILADLFEDKSQISDYISSKREIGRLENNETNFNERKAFNEIKAINERKASNEIKATNEEKATNEKFFNEKASLEKASNERRHLTRKGSEKSLKSTSASMKIEYECEPVEYILATPEDSSKLENFDKVWNAIVSMRKDGKAPVDSMGAHCLADRKADVETQRFQYLVACLLSSQTKDKNTSEAVNSLRNSGLLSIQGILSVGVDKLDEHVRMVGFHSTKARNLKKICEILKDKFGGKVPDNIKDLTSLPGIGPKMAHLILQLGFNKVEGIAVDVHVNRIVNRLGWVKTKTPEETREQLEKIIPKKFWTQLNVLLVGFGQLICTKAGPGCSTCLANSYCPVGRAVLK